MTFPFPIVQGGHSIALNETLLSILTTASLTTNLELCLDAGDGNSYTSGQSWLDTSSNGFDFTFGTDTGGASDDPDFIGTANKRTDGEHMLFDGGDDFEYDSSNETWMNNLHKNNAIFSFFMMIYVPATEGGYIWTNGTTGGTQGVACSFSGDSKHACFVLNDAGGAVLTTKTGDTSLDNSAWNMIGMSLTEATGSGGAFFYLNGAYNQVGSADTFDSTYTSPSSSAAAAIMRIGAPGTGASHLNNLTRLGMVAFWEGTALSKANFDTIWTQVRIRYGL